MIETERLRLLPLNHRQLVYYLRKDKALEEELGLTPSPRELSRELAEALAISIVPNVADPKKNHLFFTLWTIITKAGNQMVGDLCFKGDPNGAGEIEIGYGTYPTFQRKGYMSEAVGGIVQWAFRQPRVKAVVAETDKSNTASIRILQRNGFSIYKETDLFLYWRVLNQKESGK